MFRKTRVSLAIGAAIGTGLAGMGTAALAQTQQPQQLERIEITGSAIKRTDTETAQPVEIYTRKDIERTGATNVNELLRNIPSIDIFDQGELASNSPAGSGTANVRLRGLDSSNVLVLLNGRRLPINALYDSSGAGAAVDINTIPVSAIERIEILKDGGSAIYGADAVAGVFNIITRKDYRGIEARAGYGTTSYGDGTEYNVGLSAGFGDLAKDRYNFFVGLDYFNRDPIYRKDRDISKSVDFRRYGATDGRSSFAPQGNVVDPNTGGFVGIPYTACSPAETNPVGRCRYDFNASLLTAYNGAERWSGIAMGTFQLTPEIRAFAELVYSGTKDHFEAHPVPDFFLVPQNNPAQTPYRANSNFEPDPTANTVIIAGRFMQGGPRITDRDSSLMNFATGLEGTNYNLDWKVNLGYGVSKVTNKDSGYYNADLWSAATLSGQLNPTVNTNDPALVQSLKVYPTREGESTIGYLNAQVGGEMFQLPAGKISYAIGGQYWHETLKDEPDPMQVAGNVVGSIQQSGADADRSVYAMFLELSIPILKNVEGVAAVRYDHYPNESKVSPKFGVKWQALPGLMFRTTYTESFRAPVLKQLYGAQEQGAITITGAEDCALLGQPADCQINAFQVNGSNPNLTAETATTWNVGVVGDYGPFSASVDWWRITKEDNILSPTITTALQQGLFRFEQGRYLVFTNLQNYAQSANAGIDVDMKLRVPGTGLGTWTFRNLLTYYTDNSTRASDGDDWAQFNGTYRYPRYRNTFITDLETGPWAFRAMYRSVGGFWDTDVSWPIPSGTRSVLPYGEADLQVSWTGYKGLTLTGGAKNITNRQPPFSQTNGTDNQYTQMGFAELYTARGRFMYLNAAYQFR